MSPSIPLDLDRARHPSDTRVVHRHKPGDRSLLSREGLGELLRRLRDNGYQLVGPTVRDGAIVHAEISGIEDLPIGWTEAQEAGTYRLKQRSDRAFFGYSVGPQSWKQLFFVPRLRLWKLRRKEQSFTVEQDATPPPRLALIGARACDLHAIQVQDRIFLSGPHVDPDYAARRRDVFVVAVQCGQAGGTCFCVSMKAGPKATSGFDLALTELFEPHRFVVEVGTERGAEVLAVLDASPLSDADALAADAVSDATARSMGRQLDTTDIKELLYRNPEHPRWDDVAARCLGCTNCTLACPTCFCGTVEDTTDLSGETAERLRRWDSCFTLDHSHLHGGSVRASTRSRYRQWLTHKLGELDRPVRDVRLRRLRAVHHVVPGRHRHHRGGGRHSSDRRRRSGPMTEAELLKNHPFSRGLSEAQVDQLACCARAICSRREPSSSARAAWRTRSIWFASGRVVLEQHVPGKGEVQLESLTAATSSACPGCLLAAMAARRAGGRAHRDPRPRRQLPPARMEADPSLGYAVAKHVIQQLCQRLERVRLQRLDVYRRRSGDFSLPPDGARALERARSPERIPRRRHADARGSPGARPPLPPGQFNMLYAFGVGRGGHLDQRRSAAVGRARPHHPRRGLRDRGAVPPRARRRRGRARAVRRAWPLEAAHGKDLVIIAGGLGLAPLRPVVYPRPRSTARRTAGRLLYGARTPEDILFRKELEQLARRARHSGPRHRRSRGGRLEGRVGVVPALLSEVEIAAENAVAFVCGPEVMMRFCVRELGRLGSATNASTSRWSAT